MDEDLSRFCCQNPDCPDHGQRGLGNLTICARHGKHRHIRLLYCRTCLDRFSERKGTLLFGSQLSPEKAVSVFQHLADRNGVRATARLVGVAPNTVVRYGRTRVVFGAIALVLAALRRSRVSRRINTSFLERQNATDRYRNARKVRKTYTFSKDWRVHESMTYFTLYSYNFCWPVRTLAERDDRGRSCHRTPAMAAGLADHVWSVPEWITMPCVQRL